MDHTVNCIRGDMSLIMSWNSITLKTWFNTWFREMVMETKFWLSSKIRYEQASQTITLRNVKSYVHLLCYFKRKLQSWTSRSRHLLAVVTKSRFFIGNKTLPDFLHGNSYKPLPIKTCRLQRKNICEKKLNASRYRKIKRFLTSRTKKRSQV